MAHKHKKVVFWGILATELSHIFCCVLPTLFSVASLLAGLGIVIVMPAWMDRFHHMMHGWEIPAIAMAGAMVMIGWALHLHSYEEDCHDHGCHHEPCTPRKKQASVILKIATVLFVVNIIVFLGFHDGLDRLIHMH